MAMRRYAEFEKYNVFRKPDWRWQRVLEICDRPDAPGRCSRRDDEFVKAARNFLLRYRNESSERRKEELFWEHPGLYYAHEIFLKERTFEDYEPAAIIQARILAGQDPEEIATLVGTHPKTISWYEGLFFNVADRLHNRDWITKHVLVPAIMRNDWSQAAGGNEVALFRSSEVARPFFDCTLKLLAYAGGKFLVDTLLTGFRQGAPVQNPEMLGQWFYDNWSQTVKRRSLQASLTCEINKYNVMELFAINTRLSEIERSEQSQEQQRSLLERHIDAMLNALPWTVGSDGQERLAGTVLGRYDTAAAELRDDEVLRVAAGAEPDGLRDEVMTLALPAPRPASKKAAVRPEFADEDDEA